jgi:tRNA pseudouridine38-40 synthase
MFNYQILIEYDGTNFVGWQIQKNGHSVQGEIQKILKKFLKHKLIIFGAGRTDAGVHAIEQSAHFYTHNRILDKTKFLNSINFFLNKKKITILDIKNKKKNFHARYSAKKRIYKYVIINRFSSLSLERKSAWHVRRKLNIEAMKKGAKILEKTKDFSTFRSSSCTAKSPIKTLEKVRVIKKSNRIEVIFMSKSFLQQQVRSMVGCIKYLAEGKWDISKFKKIITQKNKIYCAPPAPALGLYLLKIRY